MIDPAVQDLVREAVKAAVGEAMARARGPVEITGTVDTFDPATQICGVRLDGEDDGADPTPGIPNLSGSWPHRGARVVVTFMPPAGIAVTKVLQPRGGPHCLCSSSAVQSVTGGAGSTPLTNTDTITGLTDYFDLTAGILTVLVAGWADVGLGVLLSAGSAGGRRFVGLIIDGATANLGISDVQVAASGQFIGTGSAYRELQAGSTIQPRVISSSTVDATVTELSVRWRAQRTTVS